MSLSAAAVKDLLCFPNAAAVFCTATRLLRILIFDLPSNPSTIECPMSSVSENAANEFNDCGVNRAKL